MNPANDPAVQTSILEPEVKVMLDRERTLRLDFNAFGLIEERTGSSVQSLSEKFKEMHARDISAVIWAGLVHEDPTLTVSDVGRMLTFHRLGMLMKAFMRCMHIAMTGTVPPETEEGGDAAAADPLPETQL